MALGIAVLSIIELVMNREGGCSGTGAMDVVRHPSPLPAYGESKTISVKWISPAECQKACR
ncbi:MAG: hypothetical protein ACTHW8_15020 [Sphingobacterium sp.]